MWSRDDEFWKKLIKIWINLNEKSEKFRIKIKFDAWIDYLFHSVDVNFWCWSEILEQEIFEKIDTDDWKFDYVYLVS